MISFFLPDDSEFFPDFDVRPGPDNRLERFDVFLVLEEEFRVGYVRVYVVEEVRPLRVRERDVFALGFYFFQPLLGLGYQVFLYVHWVHFHNSSASSSLKLSSPGIIMHAGVSCMSASLDKLIGVPYFIA